MKPGVSHGVEMAKEKERKSNSEQLQHSPKGLFCFSDVEKDNHWRKEFFKNPLHLR